MKTNEICKAKEMYIEEKKSLNEIGRVLGYKPYTIKLNLQKNGVKIRTRAEQNFYSKQN